MSQLLPNYSFRDAFRAPAFINSLESQTLFLRSVARREQSDKAILRADHAASIRLQLEETLGTFNGFFFVTLYLNATVQKVSFGYVSRQSKQY